MDLQTCQYYQAQPHSRANPCPALMDTALRYSPEQGAVLDVGCGSGWLSRFLDSQGRTVTATDLCKPQLPASVQWAEGTFPLNELNALLSERFGTLICAAMLMHIPDSALLTVLRQFRQLLEPGGHLVIATCTGGRDLVDKRDSRGVLYTERPIAHYELLLERLGFQTVERRVGIPDDLGREGIVWDLWVGVHNGSTLGNGVDHAISLINNDDKTTTYKLALLRALVDVALDQPHQASWMNAHSVAIPYSPIVDLWILYYFPLLKQGIPQIPPSRQPAFQKQFLELTDFNYAYELFSNAHGTDIQNRVSSLRTVIQKTIGKGPVTYAKGNQSERLFQESADRKAVVIPADLWKELSLLGHWIRDSLIFEWARVSASFAALKPEQRPRIMAEHLAVLLQDEIPERFTVEAQALYNSKAEPECVWTGRKLRTQFHVDHVIPYSQWHTNAWWNLMPSSAQANLSKSDKLPSHEVLAQARPRLMQNWDLAMRRYESDFTFEVKRDFLGSGPLGDWQNHLFDALNDRIETMAELRGLARWPGASSPQR